MNELSSDVGSRCAVAISTSSLEPIACTPAFTRLLGFADAGDCCASLSHRVHFEGHNIVQLLTLARQGRRREEISVIDRGFRKVGIISSLRIESASSRLLIGVTEATADNRNAEGTCRIEIDRRLQILKMDAAALALFGERVPGDSFTMLIPASIRSRVVNVYRRRLARHHSITIDHLTLTARAGIDRGRWHLKQYRDGYRASFVPGAAWSPTNLIIDRAGNLHSHAPSLPKILGTAVVAGNADWSHVIHTEDRAAVMALFAHPALPARHTLYYRIIGDDSVIRVVRHELRQNRRLLAGLISATEPADLSRRCLQTIALENNLIAMGNDEVRLTSVEAFQRLVTELKNALAAERLPLDISLHAAPSEPCSICGEPAASSVDLGPSDQLPMLVIEGLMLEPGELGPLVESSHSRFRVGAMSPWPRLFHLAHESGLHLSLTLNRQGQLVISVASGQG